MAQGSGPKEALLAWISKDDALVEEMRGLCLSAGFRIASEIRQRKDAADARTYLGSGKIEEISLLDGVEYLLTPADLTPSQVYSISKVTGLIVMDRIRVILEIFKERASTPESRLQVELADLHHQLPIIKEYIHQGTLSERPGFLGGGEYRVDYYYEMARKRMAHIRRELELHRKARGQKRSSRRRRGAHLISIAGYTNAGKSTLFNSIISTEDGGKTADVGPLVFTTVGTATRKMKGGRNCMVTDTVGFIRDLPPWLVEGFMSTLEEVFLSDIILLVVDGSEGKDLIARKLQNSLEVLQRGGILGKVVLVVNKTDYGSDVCAKGGEKAILDMLDPALSSIVSASVRVSAKDGSGIVELIGTVHSMLPPLVQFKAALPLTDEGFAALDLIRASAEDLEEHFQDGRIEVCGSAEERWIVPLDRRITKARGCLEVVAGPSGDEKGFNARPYHSEGC